jgi:hypothetical protein
MSTSATPMSRDDLVCNATPERLYLTLVSQISNIKLLLEQNPTTEALSKAFSTLRTSLVPPDISSKILEVFTPFIAEYLTFKDFLSLTQACRATRSWRLGIMRERVNGLLTPYGELEDFQHLMRDKGCVISGSSALWITEAKPCDWSPGTSISRCCHLKLALTLCSTGDLDLYTPYGTAQEVIDFLLAKGYTKYVKPNPEQDIQFEDNEYFQSISRLSTVTKLVRDGFRIDVLQSDSDSVITPITWFHSTAVMNYLTDKSFVMLYPAFTLDRVSVLQSGRPQQNGKWFTRYEARNYKIRGADDLDTHDYGAVCVDRMRSTNDRHCLVVPYEAENDFTVDRPTAAVANDQEDKMELDDDSGKAPCTWELCTTTKLHNYCTSDICKLKLYIKHNPATIVEFAARRTYCDVSGYLIIYI